MADPLEGRTAVNKATGERRIRRNGQWVPIAPVNTAAPGSGYLSDVSARPKLEKTDQEILATAGQQADKARSLAADAERYKRLNEKVATGGVDEWGPFGAAGKLFSGTKQEMDAITEGMTPKLREAGSGAMSDRDVQMYRDSMPSLNKFGTVNSALSRVHKAAAQRQADYAAFMDYYAQRNGSLMGSREAWDAYSAANPMFDIGKVDGQETTILRRTTPWRQWFGAAPIPGARPAAAGAGAPRPAAPRATGAPAPRPTGKPIDALMPGGKVVANGGRPMSPQEAMRLPKGARFVGMDGIERTVQ